MIVPASRLSRLDKILIAIVAALAILSVVSFERELWSYDRWWQRNSVQFAPQSLWPAWAKDAEKPARRVIQAIRIFLNVATLGIVLIAFRPGRIPRPRRRGPGYVALAIAGIVSVIDFVSFVRWHWLDAILTGQRRVIMPGEPTTPWLALVWTSDTDIAPALLAAWIYLALIGRWRKPLDPIERLGRWIGSSWISLFIVNWLVSQIRVD